MPGVVPAMIAEAVGAGVPVAESYTVTSVIPHAEKEPEVNEYTMPPSDLDEFFRGRDNIAEVIVDVRPTAEADR